MNITAIKSAISHAISDGMMSPQDVLSLSQEALQKDQETQKQSFTMKSEASRQAEKSADQPKGIMVDVAEEAKWLSPTGRVSPSRQNTKKLGAGMEAHEDFFKELKEKSKEEVQQALEEAAQKLQDEKEGILEEAVESAKETSSSGTVVESAPSTQNPSPDSSDSGDSGGQTETIPASNAASYEATVTTGSTDNTKPVLTTGSADSIEPVLTTESSSSSSSEPTISTTSSGEFKNVEVSTSKKPSAPSLDIFV